MLEFSFNLEELHDQVQQVIAIITVSYCGSGR